MNEGVADFFYIAYHTGMRFNEIKGLPMKFLYAGSLEGPLGDELARYNFTTYGYIVLESQADDKATKRLPDLSFKRKPLKTRKSISAKDARTVPITDKGAWNILARRFNAQKKLLEKTLYGSDKLNYLLFDNLNGVALNSTLKEAYKDLGKKPKTYHCCRHSKATYLVGQTRSYFLGKAILGHKSDVFDDYLHIYEMIAVQAKQSENDIQEIS
jgi:integrase